MTKTPKKKTTYNEAVRNALAVSSTEQEAMKMVQKQIDLGLVGDPKNRKTPGWVFEGTDMTITPSTGYSPTNSTRKGSNNVRTPELNAASELLKRGFMKMYNTVKNLHEEGAFSKLDLSRYEEEINKTSQHMILNFFESNTKKS